MSIHQKPKVGRKKEKVHKNASIPADGTFQMEKRGQIKTSLILKFDVSLSLSVSTRWEYMTKRFENSVTLPFGDFPRLL